MPMVKYTAVSRAAEKSAKELLNILRRHVAGVDSAYSTYNVERDRNKGLYTEEALAEQAERAQAAGRRAVAQQMEDTRSAAAQEIQNMREALYTWIAEPANPDFIAQLRTYHDFDLNMEQIEIEAMAERAAGNFVALRCLNAVAEKSGFHVNAPSLSDYMNDLREIQSAFDGLYLYAPMNGDGHAADLLPNKKYHGIDYGRPDSVAVTLAYTEARNMENKLRRIQERWSAHVQPVTVKTEELAADEVSDVVEAAARKTPDAVQIEDNGDRAVEMARQMGAQRAEAARKAKDGLKNYM